jgi:hypothetical protein
MTIMCVYIMFFSSCITLLVLITGIMTHQFFKINYLLIWHNDRGNSRHFVKTHVYNPINNKSYRMFIV